MAKYKIATTGYDIIEVEADTPEQAEDVLWDNDLNHLVNTEIVEVVEADKEFEMYTDLN